MSDDRTYFGIVLEDIRDQYKAVLEAVVDIKTTVQNQPNRSEFIALRQDVSLIRRVLTDNGAQLQDHEARITKLES